MDFNVNFPTKLSLFVKWFLIGCTVWFGVRLIFTPDVMDIELTQMIGGLFLLIGVIDGVQLFNKKQTL